jgi:fluoride exporter
VIAVILVAGALGAVIRFAVAHWLHSPWSVVLVNIVGSFIAGLAAGSLSGDLRVIALTGLCGGLTTFSTLSVETVQFALDRKWKVAIGSIAANLVLGIGAAALGLWLTS